MRSLLSARALFLAALALAAALPFLGHALSQPRGPRCSTDGVPLAGWPVVRFVGEDPNLRTFCCVGCALAWITATGESPDRVMVTDEKTGRTVDAAKAWFVRSQVDSQPATKDRVHVFAEEGDAVGHAEAYRGVLLTGSERPFSMTRDDAERMDR